jgi:hypothetical protein
MESKVKIPPEFFAVWENMANFASIIHKDKQSYNNNV